MKLYKFRPLTTISEYNRALEIINEGKFWHSKFSELNDPVEGSFTIFPNTNGLNRAAINSIYEEKINTHICSFSAKKGFREPTLWGHYANGFKGIAIEIDVSLRDVVKINYTQEIPHLKEDSDVERNAIKILSDKLVPWEIEREYRSLKKISKSGYLKVGKVTAVYFGDPYGAAVNHANILDSTRIQKDFFSLKLDLIENINNVDCYSVKIKNCKVVKNSALKTI